MFFRAEESSGQLQLIEREDIDDDEDLFEAIDKRIFTNANTICIPLDSFATFAFSSFMELFSRI